MLTELTIRDLAIIEDMTLMLRPGLTVLTGETGAGKSIILGALNLLLGERASSDDVRSEAAEAEVSAQFDVSECRPVRQALQAGDLQDEDDPGTLAVRRIISREGRSRCWINGVSTPVGSLREIGDLLVDLHGQHQHQSLLDPARHRGVLDEAGAHLRELSSVASAHAAWQEIRSARQRLEGDERDMERRREFLLFQIREIEDAALRDGELAELESERGRLRHAEALLRAAVLGVDRLQENEEVNALRLVAEVMRELQAVAEHDERINELGMRLADAEANLQDITETLRDYQSGIDMDPARLEAVEERRDLIRRLLRKHGETEAEVLAQAEAWRKEAENLENRDTELDRLRGEERRLADELAQAALVLHAAREASAEQLSKALIRELRAVAMERVAFEVRLDVVPDESGVEVPGHGRVRIGPDGMDEVEFLISPNPGEPVKPLAKIASGGELSRIMLALKAVAAGESRVPTLVFDEIDTGISGQTAARVAAKMAALAKRHQILCITHLPQIAAAADTHLGVEKRVRGKRTVTEVRALEGANRVAALATLIGGDAGSDVAIRHAEEMLGA